MPSQKNNTYKKAFDTIVFLGFIALLSVAATKASAWEQKMCEPKLSDEQPVVKKIKIEPSVILSASIDIKNK
jgi:hypothetical protein